VNVGGFLVAQVYQQERDLRLRLRDRQQVLEETFTAIHNGPLQDLAGLTRQIQDRQIAGDEPVVVRQLQKINQDLRYIFTAIQTEIVTDRPSLVVSARSDLDLDKPLHELLQEVYHEVCANELTGLQGIKVKVIQFEPLRDDRLTVAQKRSLCRFLEEALWNVGKHARSATKLWVNCGCEGNRQRIVVKDNGEAGAVGKMGEGSKQAKRIAKQLRGQFKRHPNQPKGMICQLVW
jgi:signal transduction histidine kinase